MKKKKFNHVFGPVPSRRLGRSLGVDVIPFKTCSYNCIYCQLGRTTNRTIERREYAPLKAVIGEIKKMLRNKPLPDYITLSGSGEPTLYSPVYPLIQEIKQITEIPIAVLTNGSLLYEEDVRRAVRNADLVIPSLDAGDKTVFQYVNRPHPDISFENMIRGLIEFRQMYGGSLWLEIFLLRGKTAIEATVEKIISYAKKIKPDRIQLNTVARPPAEDFAFAVPEERMNYFAQLFGEKAEVIADYHDVNKKEFFSVQREDVYNLIKRRPCSLEGVTVGLSIHRNEAVKHLQHLLKDGAITVETIKNNRFYKVLARTAGKGIL